MEERRRRRRLPWIQIQAQVRVRKGLMGSHWIDADVVDFSRMGMGVRNIKELKADDKVQFNLKLSTEVGEIVAENIPALVRHRNSTGQGVIVGIEFGDDLKASVKDALARIEGIIERHEKVTQRMQ